MLLATALLASIGPAAGQTYTPEQEQACTSDAFRLCSSEIPDVSRVTACMVAKKAQLSVDEQQSLARFFCTLSK